MNRLATARMTKTILKSRIQQSIPLQVLPRRPFWGKNSNDDDNTPLGDKAKKSMDATVKTLEKVMKDIDRTLGSTFRDAEKKLGADGFFDRLRKKLEAELRKCHQKIGKN